VIIDCHGHYTTAPPQVADWRDAQLAAYDGNPDWDGDKQPLIVSDDELRESIELNQLRIQRERGVDLTLFSPRASRMGHHLGNARVSQQWSQHCNDLIARICDLFPDNFAPVCMLPQSPGAPLDGSIRELRRCVEELGFVGCNFNPDPSGGMWDGVTLNDRSNWTFYETLCELDVPAMIHVSTSCNPHFHTLSSHYLNADTTAFVQALTTGLFRDFPDMRWIIPHGGGAVPFHWGRFKGMANEHLRKGWVPAAELLQNIWFDTCVYHQPGVDLLVDVIPADNLLFASEMLGAVRSEDPDTGEYFDDTKRYIDRADITDVDRQKIFELNALRVFPRLSKPRP
jgi:4-oxalmesaconate hydratase